MRYFLILLCFTFITLSCDSIFEKKYLIKTQVNTLSKDNISIDFEYELNVEFYGDKAQFEELSTEYNTHVEYTIKAMSTSMIRAVIGRYTKEEIDHEIPKEEIKEMVANYLNEINFKIIEFEIQKRQD